jgi:SnoaL-like domain
MTDRDAILELLARYARALDLRDWAALRECFTPDATAEYSGVVLEPGTDAIVRHLSQLGATQASSHLVGNVTVELDGDEARVSSQALVHLVHEGGVRVRGVFYSDRAVRAGGGWRLKERRHRAGWSVELGGRNA